MVAENLKYFAGHNFLFEYIISISLIIINIQDNYFGSGPPAGIQIHPMYEYMENIEMVLYLFYYAKGMNWILQEIQRELLVIN